MLSREETQQEILCILCLKIFAFVLVIKMVVVGTVIKKNLS